MYWVNFGGNYAKPALLRIAGQQVGKVLGNHHRRHGSDSPLRQDRHQRPEPDQGACRCRRRRQACGQARGGEDRQGLCGVGRERYSTSCQRDHFSVATDCGSAQEGGYSQEDCRHEPRQGS